MTTKAAVPPTTANGKQVAVKKLDIACGKRKQAGYKGIDISPECDADIVWDLNELPWPIKTSSVEQAFCSHYVEHIPHWRPGWEKDGWFRFFDEVWRICKPDAELHFHHPYNRSDRAFWDPTHVRFINEVSWYYLSKEWREVNELGHYAAECDFDVVNIAGTNVSDDFSSRNQEMQDFQRAHYWNVLPDLHVILRAIK